MKKPSGELFADLWNNALTLQHAAVLTSRTLAQAASYANYLRNKEYKLKYMNQASPTSVHIENEAIRLAIILPLTEYRTRSIIDFQDFHGQEEGEDPEYDEIAKRTEEAEQKLYAAIQTYAQKYAAQSLAQLERKAGTYSNVTYDFGTAMVVSEEKAVLLSEITKLREGLER